MGFRCVLLVLQPVVDGVSSRWLYPWPGDGVGVESGGRVQASPRPEKSLFYSAPAYSTTASVALELPPLTLRPLALPFDPLRSVMTWVGKVQGRTSSPVSHRRPPPSLNHLRNHETQPWTGATRYSRCVDIRNTFASCAGTTLNQTPPRRVGYEQFNRRYPPPAPHGSISRYPSRRSPARDSTGAV